MCRWLKFIHIRSTYRRSQIFRAKNISCAKNSSYLISWLVNMDHTLYVTLCMSTVGTATMDTLRSLERERRDKLILLEMVLQSHSLHQLSNVDQIVTEGCGQIDTNDQSTSFVMNYHLVGVTGIVDGSGRENYRYR